MNNFPFADFQFAALMEERQKQVNPKAPRYSMQELADVLTEMKELNRKEQAQKQLIADKIRKAWTNDELDEDELLPDSFSDICAGISTFLTHRSQQKPSITTGDRWFAVPKEIAENCTTIKYFVVAVSEDDESNMCELRSRGRVFTVSS
jgi:hypothetical protein